MEMLADPNLLKDTIMRDLYDASLKGCVNTLKTLIQRDPLILRRVSLYPFSHTPLHIASLLGHLEFCQVLLDTNPRLAGEVDSEGRCPLHLASAEGHTEIVKALLLTKPEISMSRDKDYKLPLQFASMRGRVEAIEELMNARPDSIREMIETDDGSILHLCVLYNHLEAFKIIVESMRGDHQFLSIRDREGDTVLHLAVRHRQIKVIKYLLSLSEMSSTINTLNRAGLTPLDMLERCPRDLITLTIEHILTEEGAQRSANTISAQQPAQPSPPRSSSSSGWDRFENFCTTYLIKQGNWVDKKTREQWMVAATVMATMTFQSALSPPGGIWQADTHDGSFTCNQYDYCEAGTAVVGYVWSSDFLKFIFFNSTSFFASLCVVLVLISGFPLKNKVIMYILAILMLVAITCMLLTYMWALGLVSPNHIYNRTRDLGYILVGIWSFLLFVVGLIQTTRVVFWFRSRGRRSSINNKCSRILLNG